MVIIEFDSAWTVIDAISYLVFLNETRSESQNTTSFSLSLDFDLVTVHVLRDLVLLQIHIFCGLVPIAVKGYIAIGKGWGNISDDRLGELNCPEFCAILRAAGYYIH
jgi:hypothetical protein